MAIRKFKPTSPGRRGMSSQDFSTITKGKPEKVTARKEEPQRRSQQLWSHDVAIHWWRPQEALSPY